MERRDSNNDRTNRRAASRCFFSIVNGNFKCYEARSAISLFQMKKLFSHHFQSFKLKIFYPRNSRNPIRFPALSTSTQMTDNTIRSYVQTNLFTDDKLLLDEASYSNTPSFVYINHFLL